MSQVLIKPPRNQSIECARMIAAVLVVFIHCQFPGALGGVMNVLGHFAVPMFLAISGYFSYRLSGKKILARLKHLLKLYLYAELAYLVWHIFVTEWQGGSTVSYLRAAVPEMDEAARWLFMSIPPYVGHLWYLLAVIACYLILWGYVQFFGEKSVNYQPLYLVSVCLMADHILAGALIGEPALYWCRTVLFFGLPLFSLGMFLHEYQDALYTNFGLTTSKQVLLMVFGMILAIVQWSGGIETGNLEFGTIIGTIGLMLLLIAHPVIAKADSVVGRCISRFGSLSMLVYILHLMVVMAYELVLQQPMEDLLGGNEPWLRPLVVLGISLVVATVWERGLDIYKKWTKLQ